MKPDGAAFSGRTVIVSAGAAPVGRAYSLNLAYCRTNVIAFLLSDEASFLVGTCDAVSGGPARF